MDECFDEEPQIEGRELTGWAVLPGGAGIPLSLAAANDRTYNVLLPFELMSSLLMTLPRMLQAALNARGFGGTMRVAQPLARWRIEEAVGTNGLVLKLATPDGFEVAFSIDGNAAEILGKALVATAGVIEPVPKAALH
jgi:hypothetical protein